MLRTKPQKHFPSLSMEGGTHPSLTHTLPHQDPKMLPPAYKPSPDSRSTLCFNLPFVFLEIQLRVKVLYKLLSVTSAPPSNPRERRWRWGSKGALQFYHWLASPHLPVRPCCPTDRCVLPQASAPHSGVPYKAIKPQHSPGHLESTGL